MTSIRSQVIHGEAVKTHEEEKENTVFLSAMSGVLEGASVCLKNDIAIPAASDKAREARDEDGVC